MPYQIEQTPDEKLGEVEKFDREVQIQTILRVLEFRTQNGGISSRKACQELGVNYRAFLRWLRAGVLTEYVKQHRDPEVELLGLRAMQAMPQVLENMIALAAGLKTQRGVNPVAAANFVKDMMQDLAPKPDPQESAPQPNMFMPVFYPVPYRDAAPVIEAEFRNLPAATAPDEEGET